MENAPRKTSSRWGLYLILLLFVVITVVFVIEFVSTTATEMAATPEATPELSADTYMDVVNSLLANAHPENGPLLLAHYGCVACHRIGAANDIAPSFSGVAARAATRRPPLSAAAYIYESIVNPTAYVVQGFNPVMPQDFRSRISDADLGDIIAYLLTPDAQ